MMWNLYQNEELVNPLLYSTGKGQDSVIKEILEAFESYRVVFLEGAVGTGKSAIALNVASKLKGGMIVVPTKILENQYENDYCNKYRILQDNKRWMKIGVIKGRSNFNCLYNKYLNCSDKSLPCTRPLPKIKGRTVSRLEIASKCPFYSPIIRSDLEEKYCNKLECQFETLKYEGAGNDFSILRRSEEVCPFFQQYREYKEADVIMMNSAIWLLESLSLMRKPLKPVEIIDEGDSLLDSLSLKKAITQQMLTKTFKKVEEGIKKDDLGEEELRKINEITDCFVKLVQKEYEGEVTKDYVDLLKSFVNFLEKIGDENAGSYSDILTFIDNAYVSVLKNKIEYFIPEPKIVVKKLLDLSADKIMFMSATFQSQRILEKIFGFDDFCFVKAETKFPGTIYSKRTGNESSVTYKAWQQENFKKMYWRNLAYAIKQSAKPCIIPVHAYKYLPEKIRKKIKGSQTLKTDNGDIIFSTVMKRGVDLRDNQCRSIIMLKFPFPNLSDPILKAMKLKLGDKIFWMYYHDIAKREFIQTIGRGLRHEDDWIELWSPDKSVQTYLIKLWKGEIEKSNRKQSEIELEK